MIKITKITLLAPPYEPTSGGAFQAILSLGQAISGVTAVIHNIVGDSDAKNYMSANTGCILSIAGSTSLKINYSGNIRVSLMRNELHWNP